MNPEMMTDHQKRVAEFMNLAGQKLPDKSRMPPEEVRELRARLILEEALETIDALGFCTEITIRETNQKMTRPMLVAHDRGPNLREIADGCADISVVTIGTLLACGIADKSLLEEVDRSNLAKFELPKCPTHPNAGMQHLADNLGTRNLGNYRCNFSSLVGGQCSYHARGPYRREDGKWIKPPYWKEPDIEGAILISDVIATLRPVVWALRE
jgi:predicted HAD superfamily Cof-like phosphohydrolase